MEIKRLAGLISLLTLTACHSAGQSGAAPAKSDAPTEWKFNFFTPRALPALVTFAVIVDESGEWVSRYVTLDSTKALYDVAGGWNDSARALNGHWNRVKYPPRHIFFCWDSIIDKKVYETRITFSAADIEKMKQPSKYKDHSGNVAYYDSIQIGLAPGGKVAVWLDGIGFEPNYRITPSALTTLSGDKLEICKDVTKHPNGYKYYGETPDFIKGKTYPYGSW
jgi:hypothetical protein